MLFFCALRYLWGMSNIDETLALCALNKLFGYTPAKVLPLLEDSAGAWSLFQNPDLGLDKASLDWAAGELERVRAGGFRFIGLTDEDYPEPLRACPDPPLGLYLNGTSSPAEIFSLRPMVAIVGTRDISPYGKDWCQRIVRCLADAPVQPVIVSGLAIGADGIAHREALEAGIGTVGVMATGIERVYPWQHEALAARMVRTPGCAILTDYPLGTAPVAQNFIRRNRIIAGLARGIIVVESKSRGGSLMTARYGCDYARDVYALPGRADDLRSAGCNSLIREQMAEIITTPEDLAARLGLGAPVRGSGGSWITGPEGYRNALEKHYGTGAGPGPDAIRLGMAVYRQRGIGPEELAAQLRLPYPHVLQLMSLMEADGFIVTDLLRRCTARERR